MKERQITIKQATQELTLQGFKPSVSGFNISLRVWNEELTDAYEIEMSQPHIEWLANQYSKRLTDANQAMKTQYGIND
tara:strand:- start:1696 stop:1929 length:234 start_codon:yes stop_codon:yes gene_type:complete